MRSVLKTIVILGGLLTSLFGLDRARLAGAEQETKVSHSRRGGILVAAEGHRFEVFFYPTGVRVFPARCCWERLGHLEAYRKRHCFLPRCARQSTRFHDRSIPCRPIQVPHPRPWSRASASRMLQRRQRLSSSRSSVFPVRLRPPRRSGFRWNSSPRQPTPTPISPPSHARSQGSATRAIVRTSSLNQGLCPSLPIVRTSSLNQGLCPSLRKPRLHTLELAWILVATPRRMQRPRA